MAAGCNGGRGLPTRQAATRVIRQRWPDIHVVGLSVQSDAATAQSMRAAGAAAFVAESDDAEHMFAAILPLLQTPA